MKNLPPKLRPTVVLRFLDHLQDGLGRDTDTALLIPPVREAEERLRQAREERLRHDAAGARARTTLNRAQWRVAAGINSLWNSLADLLPGDRIPTRRLLFPEGLKPETRPTGPGLLARARALLARSQPVAHLLPAQLQQLSKRVQELAIALAERDKAALALSTAQEKERELVQRASMTTQETNRQLMRVCKDDMGRARAAWPRVPRHDPGWWEPDEDDEPAVDSDPAC